MYLLLKITLLAIASTSTPSFAQPTSIAVGAAKTKKPVVALVSVDDSTIQKTIAHDLEFLDLFKLLPKENFAQPTLNSVTPIKFPDWAKTGTDYVGFGSTKVESGKLSFEFHLSNIGGNTEVLAKRYTAASSEAKVLAHQVANDIVFAITGKKGIFLTRIAFACDKTGKKEIYTMNFDGSDVHQITKIRSISMAPAWSPDGSKIAFSVYNKHSDNVKNLDLFEYNLKSGSLRLLSNRKGINSGASYAPSGNKLALTMSYTGNPTLHLLDLDTKQTTQLTHSLGFDVDPNFSPDGSKIAFVSSRPGKPMLYVAPTSNAGDAKRLTFAGQYNATPDWSPDGKKIVFAGWLEKHFDLFTITADGAKIDRLTKDEGNNEDPFYSPDGSFIAFSSSREGGKNIFMMSVDGGNVKRLTFGLGNCVAPKWSPYLN